MTIACPYDGVTGPWLRGNLHTHTTRSDGALTPEEVNDLYVGLGYDFLALSDHDTLTWPPDSSLVTIPSVEVTRGGPHLLAVGVEREYDPETPRGVAAAAIVADGGLAIACHPNWLKEWSHWSQGALRECGHLTGVEIYNGVVEFLPGSALAVDRWDRLLSAGLIIWGFAHDDFHRRGNEALGWLAVAAEPTAPAILAALREGRFYASCGVTIDRLAVEEETFLVETADADCVRFIGQWGVVLRETRGPVARYELTGREGYVRAECLGRGRAIAWSQPIWVDQAG